MGKPDLPDWLNSQDLGPDTTLVCTACKAEWTPRFEGTVCADCGGQLIALDGTLVDPAGNGGDDLAYCKDCGAILQGSGPFCEACTARRLGLTEPSREDHRRDSGDLVGPEDSHQGSHDGGARGPVEGLPGASSQSVRPSLGGLTLRLDEQASTYLKAYVCLERDDVFEIADDVASHTRTVDWKIRPGPPSAEYPSHMRVFQLVHGLMNQKGACIEVFVGDQDTGSDTPNGQRSVTVSLGEPFEIIQQTVMFIPVTPKRLRGFHVYAMFLNSLEERLGAKDPSAVVRTGIGVRE